MSAYGPRTVRRCRRTRDQLDDLDAAITDAVAADYPVTLRGVYYRVVSAGAVDKTEAGYRAVARRLLELRRGGLVPYEWITDGTRVSYRPATWTNVDHALADAAASYRRGLWTDQGVEVIVISEKDAISGVIHPITDELQVELAVTRGYSSETFTHSVAATVAGNSQRGVTTFLFQLGDHDPSGVDAWRSFQERVLGFAPDARVEFQRLAVTPVQIDVLDLPTRPTKTTDTRAAGFAGGSVEVDAIPANLLRAILRSHIEAHIDPHTLELTRTVEAQERAVLERLSGGSSWDLP